MGMLVLKKDGNGGGIMGCLVLKYGVIGEKGWAGF